MARWMDRQTDIKGKFGRDTAVRRTEWTAVLELHIGANNIGVITRPGNLVDAMPYRWPIPLQEEKVN